MWGGMYSSGPMGRHVLVRFHRACCMLYLSLGSLSLDVRSAVLEPRSYSAGRARNFAWNCKSPNTRTWKERPFDTC
ncbi:hypothetical protein EDB84DRAFT_368256 [Lactarius hengduanensis]|nr:hypothetical protein EDB84DRAFT_368256 [Lactarius hengduanensis]